MNQLRIVTTSWDDGDRNDLRVAELLQARGLTGTFYVPARAYNGNTLLTEGDLRDLRSQGLEIGAHSVSHKNLSTLSAKELDQEVKDSKTALEQSLGEQVSMFCYPNGRYNATVIRHVRKAAYRGARTTRMLSLNMDFEPFEMPTSIQAYPHRTPAYIRNLARAKSVPGLMKYVANAWGSRTWVELGIELFDRMLHDGGIWHLYGHSWEIDQLGLWGEMTDLLNYVSHHHEVVYATNGQSISLRV